MDLSKIPLMAAIKDRMQWLNRNQTVLAKNIANSDTPGYKPQALAAQDFSALVDSTSASRTAGPRSVGLRATQSGHFAGAGDGSDGLRVVDAPVTEVAPDGNAVDLEEQLLAVAQNQMDHGMMVELYRKQVGFLRSALRGSNGN
ncbi:flagellar basal body rod protein FlgB [Iodidimonas muriae]|uniref:Flagellar basal body rod protein FlgB n=1 Tax=Iodidimonas muriae TaxID=261467 RepID=A0ABQ2LFW9_9PROT|nr:flagellar basal body rod protein FlgB [Iodidimonas muriae]GER08639.1 flagellar basal body rod protein FlgB [Kordiimonadales bacterium JCM 17843]GGO15703.1 flagellar basal body rod protein FlgB [Iodidimonas muriae]